ncbi:MAG: hypothetical protein ACE5IK_02635, partial [Acidobacteriota bacterium]
IRIHVGPAVIEGVIRAAVPHVVELDAGLFRERVVLDDPHAVRLVAGGLDLEMTATGSPVPFSAEVAPHVRLLPVAAGGWQVAVDSLPVTVGRLGTYDLASFIDPVPIETVVSSLLALPGGELSVELTVTAVEITSAGIEIRLRPAFTPVPRP